MKNLKRLKFKRLVSVVAAAAACMGFADGAYANPAGTPDQLLQGATLFLNGNPKGVYEQFAFTGPFSVIASKMTIFTSSTFSGSLFSQVIAGDTHNPLGGYDFVYQITNSQSDPGGIHRMTVNGFDDGLYTGFIQIPPSEVLGANPKRPTTVDRSVFGVGETVGWNFMPNPTDFGNGPQPTPGVLGSGQTSALLIMYTASHTFANTTAQFIDGSVASTATFAPNAPIPEPDTYAMMLAGLGLMGFMARRRKDAKTAA